MIVLLLVLINILALYAILAKDLMQGVLALAGLSLFSTLLFYIFHAPDVAITEAAVGTGVSTVIFVWAIRSTDSSAENRKPRKYYRIWENILSMVIAGIVLPAVFLMDTPWPVYARNYLEQYGVQETGAQNLVSSIYLDYRLIDTLGETIVLLAAISGTIALMHSSIKKDAVSPAETASAAVPSRASGPKSTGRASLRTVLMQVAAGKLGPVVLLFGMYVMFFGHLSPGGGFYVLRTFVSRRRIPGRRCNCFRHYLSGTGFPGTYRHPAVPAALSGKNGGCGLSNVYNGFSYRHGRNRPVPFSASGNVHHIDEFDYWAQSGIGSGADDTDYDEAG